MSNHTANELIMRVESMISMPTNTFKITDHEGIVTELDAKYANHDFGICFVKPDGLKQNENEEWVVEVTPQSASYKMVEQWVEGAEGPEHVSARRKQRSIQVLASALEPVEIGKAVEYRQIDKFTRGLENAAKRYAKTDEERKAARAERKASGGKRGRRKALHGKSNGSLFAPNLGGSEILIFRAGNKTPEIVLPKNPGGFQARDQYLAAFGDAAPTLEQVDDLVGDVDYEINL